MRQCNWFDYFLPRSRSRSRSPGIDFGGVRAETLLHGSYADYIKEYSTHSSSHKVGPSFQAFIVPSFPGLSNFQLSHISILSFWPDLHPGHIPRPLGFHPGHILIPSSWLHPRPSSWPHLRPSYWPHSLTFMLHSWAFGKSHLLLHYVWSRGVIEFFESCFP